MSGMEDQGPQVEGGDNGVNTDWITLKSGRTITREQMENGKQWVDALRSGKYKQGRKRLRHAGRHCCLGVLCDVYQQVTGKGSWQWVLGSMGFMLPRVGGGSWFDATVLPDRALPRWVGFPDEGFDWNLGVLTDSSSLTQLNDDGSDFGAIAEEIEQFYDNFEALATASTQPAKEDDSSTSEEDQEDDGSTEFKRQKDWQKEQLDKITAAGQEVT
jgi:hypothetical protein